MQKRILGVVLAILLMLPLCGGCRRNVSVKGDKPLIYTSFFPIYDLTRQVAGDTVDIRTLMPIDKDPHLWEPTPASMKALTEADLLIVNGANMEKWLDQVRDAIPGLEVLVLSDFIELITYKGAAAIGDFQFLAAQEGRPEERYKIDFGHTHEDLMRVSFMRRSPDEKIEKTIERGKKQMEAKGTVIQQEGEIAVEEGQVYAIEMGHEAGEVFYRLPEAGEWLFISDRVSERLLPYTICDHNGEPLDIEVLLEGSTSGFDKITYDPHSWIGLGNAKKYLNTIHDELVRRFPENKRLYGRNKLKAVDALTDLEYEYKDKFKDLKRREFVVTHYAYEYLAKEFDLIQFPLQGLVSTETPSLKTIRRALGFCQNYGIKEVFYEQGHDPAGARTLAEELKGEAVPLTSMEYIFENPDELNYTEIMRENLEKLYSSLSKGQ
ncbi:MAG: zinc ABC transporter substrate-binding protein [Eubacteriales bacterium]|nr:zinc ABC transporter substrate-binding protein [Eubacteriales bacterium]